MATGPKEKSKTGPARRDPVSQDSVSLVVAVALVALGAGGVLSVFSGPLLALVTH